jgi:hypothetical protein
MKSSPNLLRDSGRLPGPPIFPVKKRPPAPLLGCGTGFRLVFGDAEFIIWLPLLEAVSVDNTSRPALSASLCRPRSFCVSRWFCPSSTFRALPASVLRPNTDKLCELPIALPMPRWSVAIVTLKNRTLNPAANLRLWPRTAALPGNSAQTVQLATAISVWEGVYTKEQAARGKTRYFTLCAVCHGAQLHRW